jgi:hypothetical protein
MKKVLQFLDYEYPLHSIGWKKWADKIILISNAEEGNPNIPLVMGTNLANRDHRNWIINKRPYIALNRQLTRGWCDKHRSMGRISVNSYASTKLGNVIAGRWNSQGLEKNPWKVTEVKNVLIAPPEKSIWWWTGNSGDIWANTIELNLKAQGANVRVRIKERKRGHRYTTLFQDLDWADLVVSYSSAITVEAFWYGKKAISLGVCPTWIACENRLKHWADPTEPANRDIWHEHIANIQFTYDEFDSGEAQEMTLHYQGWPTEVQALDNAIVIPHN